MNVRRLMRLSLLIVALLVIVWGYGFVGFVHSVEGYHESMIDEQTEPTDAVVVLTGGSERLAEGLKLLSAGKAKKLLVSGVHPSVKVGVLLSQSDMPQALKECCIVLGREADNTIGNALETQAFMKNEGFHTLRLVTAHYHMPRSLLLFNRIMPDIVIVPHAVLPDAVDLHMWWEHPGTFNLLVQEYTKYLYAWVRLSF